MIHSEKGTRAKTTAIIARTWTFPAVRDGSTCSGRVPPSTQPFTPVPLTSTDNAEADGSIPSIPTKKT
jgi:hypothetical protein